MATTRTRRRNPAGNEPVDRLNSMINTLIAENRKLRKQVEKLSAAATGPAASKVEKGLRSLARRVERAVSASSTPTTRATGSRRRMQSVAKPRKPVSPEVAEKRRQALAKAREVRKAKAQAASGSEASS